MKDPQIITNREKSITSSRFLKSRLGTIGSAARLSIRAIQQSRATPIAKRATTTSQETEPISCTATKIVVRLVTNRVAPR